MLCCGLLHLLVARSSLCYTMDGSLTLRELHKSKAMSMHHRLSPVALVVALVLASCAAPAVRPPNPPLETRAISLMVFGEPAEKAAYEELIAAFHTAHPDIRVELIHIPSQRDYQRRLSADFAAGTPADLVLINYRRYANFAARGVLHPIGDYVYASPDLSLNDFYQPALAPFYWNNELMCMPQNLSSLVVYYNKDLFDQAGLAYPTNDWTWDDFLRTAQALTRDLDGDGQTDQHGLGTDPSLFRVAPFIWQNNGDLVNNPSNPTRLSLDDPQSRAAVAWFVELQTVHGVVPDAVAEQAENSESRFLTGRLAMFLNSRRGVPTYRTITTFDWDVAPLPQGLRRAGILHSDAYCMTTATQDKDAAWQFIAYAVSEAGQSLVAQSGRIVPSRKAVAESPAFLDPQAKPANSRIFIEHIEDIRAVPVMSTWVDIEEIVGKEIERAFYGQASVDEAIRTAITNSQEYFELAVR